MNCPLGADRRVAFIQQFEHDRKRVSENVAQRRWWPAEDAYLKGLDAATMGSPMPRAFFFPHSMGGTRLPLSRRPKFPSRVAPPVEGTEVTSAGTSTSRGFVVADGFWFQGHPPATGSNQDPCVFSTPLGPLHAFCRVERPKGSDNYVVRLGDCAGQLLPDEVKQGDVILMASLTSADPRFASQSIR